MKKLAFFVEGRTELFFLDKLIKEIAGRLNVMVCHAFISGGTNVPKSINYLHGHGSLNTAQCQYFILIYDCGGDQQVLTRINEEKNNLAVSQYQKIIGIRDLYPRYTTPDIPLLNQGVQMVQRTSGIPIEMIFSIMELEALFLAESTHFPKVDGSITSARILSDLGIDIENEDLELRPNPAKDLDDCYALGGKNYIKGGNNITIDLLDYEELYVNLPVKFSSLKSVVDNIESFLS